METSRIATPKKTKAVRVELPPGLFRRLAVVAAELGLPKRKTAFHAIVDFVERHELSSATEHEEGQP